MAFEPGIGKLYYVDDECLDMVQAFFYTLIVGNTYTELKSTAEEMASLWGECYPERDANRPEYWYHYHIGNRKTKIGNHVFYGTNGYGEYPVSR